eukprot:gene29289-33861_t
MWMQRLHTTVDSRVVPAADWDLPRPAPRPARRRTLKCAIVHRALCFSCCTAWHHPKCPGDVGAAAPKGTGNQLLSGMTQSSAHARFDARFHSRLGAQLTGAQRRPVRAALVSGMWRIDGGTSAPGREWARAVAQAVRIWTAAPAVAAPLPDACRARLRRVVVPPAAMFTSNIGHRIGDVFAAVLEAQHALPGRVDLILAENGTCFDDPQGVSGAQALFDAVAPIGIPADGTCVDALQVACPDDPCPFYARRGRVLPVLRRFLAARFAVPLRRRPAASTARRPHIVIAQRYPGKRYIANPGALSAAARAA